MVHLLLALIYLAFISLGLPDALLSRTAEALAGEAACLVPTEGGAAMLCGVCGGIAEYFGIDPSIVRLVWAALVLFGGTGVLLYIIAAIILPRKSQIYPGY